MAKKRPPNAYKGIPRDQWPAARLARGEEPLAVGAKVRDPNAVPLDDVPRETFVGEHTQPVYAPNPGAGILPQGRSKMKGNSQPGRRDFSMGAGPAGTHDVRRKPDATFSAPKTEAKYTEDGVAAAIPPNLFAKGVKQLEVFSLDGDTTNPLPGFRLHWFVDENDSGVRLKQAQQSGWEFVGKDEVMVSDTISISNSDLGGHIRKLASKSSAVYQYLMKKPLEIQRAHDADYANRVILPIKEALKRGQISNNPNDMQYKHPSHNVEDAKTYTTR